MTARKWWLSDDQVVHAYPHPLPDGGQPVVAAACGHEAPKHELLHTDEGPRCAVCTLLAKRDHAETVDHSKGDVIDLNAVRQRRGRGARS